MSSRTPKVWCADLVVSIDPCARPGQAVEESGDFPRRNDLWSAADACLELSGAGNEVVAFQLVVEKRAGRLESLRLEGHDGIAFALFQNIALMMQPVAAADAPAAPPDRYFDDPLVPLEPGSAGDIVAEVTRQAPRVRGRRRQTFTVELHLPGAIEPGTHDLSLVARVGGEEFRIRLALTAYDFSLPEEATCVADINNYGRAPASGFSGLEGNFDRYLRIERGYYRMAREHQGVFHLLPYSQSGRIEPGCAPRLEGRGRHRRVADWTPFDRHFGPYLDGSAFAGTRGGEHPVEYLYLPVNLNWPAYFEKFGTPGYACEYGNVLGEMARHFAERGWTRTTFEVFFDHKARYKYYPWDMDEIRFPRDNQVSIDLARMATAAVKDVPEVTLANRIDSSWIFAESARGEMGDAIELWVIGCGSPSRAPDEIALLREKGRAIWFYGGPGPIAAPDRLETLHWPWMTWGREVDGFTWWSGLHWGSWDQPGPGKNHCFYPGARFGIDGPLAGSRLKVMHRGMQDHAYLSLLGLATGSRAAADEILGRTIGAGNREDWYERGGTAKVSGAEIHGPSATDKPWKKAPRSAWNTARAALARAVERAK